MVGTNFYCFSMTSNRIDIAIISYNCYQMTADCIDSIRSTASDLVGKIIVVDNNSTDGTSEKIQETYPEIKLIANNDNRGYAAAVNQSVAASSTEFVIVSNADVVFLENSVQSLLECIESDPGIAVCGPQQVYPDGKLEYSYGLLPGLKLGLKNLFFISPVENALKRRRFSGGTLPTTAKSVGYVDGAVCCFHRKAFDELGGFDEDYFFYAEEMDFNSRCQRNGWKSVFCPAARVIHYRGGSSARLGEDPAKVEMFIEAKFLYFSKNLSRGKSIAYARMEILHHYLMSFLWKAAITLASKEMKKEISSKIRYYDELKKAWKKGLERYKKQ